MARSFQGVPISAYQGTLFNQPASSSNAQFAGQPPLPPIEVVLQVPWTNYGAGNPLTSVGVTVNLQSYGPVQKLDRVRGVRIDNLGNPVPVYVYFPDTNFTVVAPPNTVVWEPVKTGQFNAYVFGEGFTANNVGATFVYFLNYAVIPFIDYEFSQSAPLWLASANITRGGTIYNENYGVPALGDQTIQYTSEMAASTIGVLQNNLWGTPYASGFLYLTHVDFSFIDFTSPGGNWAQEFVLESTGTAGIIYDLNAGGPAGVQPPTSVPLLNFSGMNIKLDATQNYRLRNVRSGNITSFLQAVFNYTTNPN